MKRVLSVCLLLVTCVAAGAVPVKLQPEIMGIGLGMSRDAAHARLQPLGKLEKEERKRQEVWVLKDQRISHLLIGYDPNFRVRYVTALARAGGARMRYDEVAELKTAQRTNTQGNYKFTWQVAARSGQPAYVLIAHGRDPQYLDSYSVKKLD